MKSWMRRGKEEEGSGSEMKIEMRTNEKKKKKRKQGTAGVVNNQGKFQVILIFVEYV